MAEWFTEQQCSLYSFWLCASVHQRPEHLIASMGYSHGFGGPKTYNRCHICIQKWDTLFSGSTAFLEVFEAIKRWERKYRSPLRYSIILHGRRGTPKDHIKYMLGCYINYTSFTGELKISHVNRKVPVFVAMLKTARQYGADFEIEQPTKEQRLAEARNRVLRRRVLNM
jgi:hypothetical protein